MEIKNIEKIAKYFERLKKVDAQVIQIEKLADKIANKDLELSLTLKGIDIEMKKELESKDNHNENNGLGIMEILHSYGTFRPEPNKDEYTIEVTENFTHPHIALSLLGAILEFKNKERGYLLKQINKLKNE